MYPSSSPKKRKQYRDAFEARHPGRSRMLTREWNLKRKYGLTIADWDAIFAAQNLRCAACKSNKPSGNYWHTDHEGPLPCTRDRVRGILCLHCNHTIGKGTRADVDRLRALIVYLEKRYG